MSEFKLFQEKILTIQSYLQQQFEQCSFLKEQLQEKSDEQLLQKIQNAYQIILNYDTFIMQSQQKIDKYVKIANETDPDKKIYGLSMCKNIFNLDMIFDDVKKLLEQKYLFEELNIQVQKILEENDQKLKQNQLQEALLLQQLQEEIKQQEIQRMNEEQLKLIQQREQEIRIKQLEQEEYDLIIQQSKYTPFENLLEGINTNGLKSLNKILQQIIKDPSNSNFRLFRQENENFIKELGNLPNIKMIMINIGFYEITKIQDQNLQKYWQMDEPKLESSEEYENWCIWFEQIKQKYGILLDRLNQL